jgi:hypothetical protein
MPQIIAEGKTFEVPIGTNLRQILIDNCDAEPHRVPPQPDNRSMVQSSSQPDYNLSRKFPWIVSC